MCTFFTYFCALWVGIDTGSNTENNFIVAIRVSPNSKIEIYISEASKADVPRETVPTYPTVTTSERRILESHHEQNSSPDPDPGQCHPDSTFLSRGFVLFLECVWKRNDSINKVTASSSSTAWISQSTFPLLNLLIMNSHKCTALCIWISAYNTLHSPVLSSARDTVSTGAGDNSETQNNYFAQAWQDKQSWLIGMRCQQPQTPGIQNRVCLKRERQAFWERMRNKWDLCWSEPRGDF